MALIYLDSSVVVPMFASEPSTAAVLARVEDCAPCVSDLVRGEASAALAAKGRAGVVDPAELPSRYAALDRWIAAQALVTLVNAGDVADEIVLVRQSGLALKLPDAIHLATCRARKLPLLTRDRGMANAAEVLGISSELLA